MRLFHPQTVLYVALVLVSLLQIVIGAQYDRSARQESPRGNHAGFPLDDAWIHQVYARSFSSHFSFNYNSNEPEVGQSSLLWGGLLAPVHALAEHQSWAIGQATRVFGILIWIATALALAALIASLPIPGARFGAFSGALLVALDPSCAFAAVSGMEALLLSLLVLLGFVAIVHDRPLLAGIFGGLAILTRPEGILFALVITLFALRKRGSEEGGGGLRIRNGALVLLPAACLASVWMIFCLVVSGRPFPNPYYVKAAAQSPWAAIEETFSLLAGLFERSPFYANYVGYIFLTIGILALLTRCGTSRSLLFLASPLIYLFGIAATRPLLDPEAFYWARYLVPIVPLLLLPLALGLASAGSLLGDLVRKPKEVAGEDEQDEAETDVGTDVPAETDGEDDLTDGEEQQAYILPTRAAQPIPIPDLVLAIAVAFLSVLPFLSVPGPLWASIQEYAANVKDVDSMNVEAALWIHDQTGLPENALIASQDAGAIRYFSGHDVLDLIGLNDHRLVTAGLDGGDGAVAAYIGSRKPAVVCLLYPDPYATDFLILGGQLRMKEVARFQTEEYSLFGESIPHSVIVLADLPP